MRATPVRPTAAPRARAGRDRAIPVRPAQVSRFVREATVAAWLQHPGVTVVFAADVHDGRLFIVTELLSGKDLGTVLAAHPDGLLLQQVLDFGAQLADALAAAYAKGIIHRDLKPANLFVQADEGMPGGRLKEQWRAAAVGPGADLYAAGCILCEMATGRVPFEAPSLPELMAQHLTRPPGDKTARLWALR